MNRAAGYLRGLLAAAIAITACVSTVATSTFSVGADADAATETRALWVLRTSLGSPESIGALVRSAKEHGFNTLFVQVRGRGDAYYSGGPEPRAPELLRQPDTF